MFLIDGSRCCYKRLAGNLCELVVGGFQTSLSRRSSGLFSLAELSVLIPAWISARTDRPGFKNYIRSHQTIRYNRGNCVKMLIYAAIFVVKSETDIKSISRELAVTLDDGNGGRKHD